MSLIQVRSEERKAQWEALNQLREELTGRPKGYRCVQCRREPWVTFKDGTHALRCSCGFEGVDETFDLEPIGNWMKEKLKKMVEQQTKVGGAIVIHDHKTALARATEANMVGLWQQTANDAQLQLIAKAALAYGLDPLMGELILYQGKPFIGIDGRRRLDSRAGHHPSIKFRPLTPEEREWFMEAEAMEEGDLCGYCVLEDRSTNQIIEGFGKVTKAQREEMRTNQKGSYKANPVLAAHPIEMFEKRCETRARKMAYGPNPIPAGLEGIMGDEEEIIEGTARVLDNTSIAEPATEDAQEPVQDSQPPQELPIASDPDDDWEKVVDAATQAGMTWDAFELQVLKCTKTTFIKRRDAGPKMAMILLNNYIAEQG